MTRRAGIGQSGRRPVALHGGLPGRALMPYFIMSRRPTSTFNRRAPAAIVRLQVHATLCQARPDSRNFWRTFTAPRE